MKIFMFAALLTALFVVECSHTFMGTNVRRPMVYHHTVEYKSKFYQKRVENLYYALPAVASNNGRTIQGILAYDLTYSTASANVTQGGIGYRFINLRMKSERGEKIKFDVYVYA